MKRLIGVFALMLLSVTTHAQEQARVEIYFDQGSGAIDRDYTVNGAMLDKLTEELSEFTSNSAITIKKIEINSYASPEGGVHLNKELSLRRAEAVKDYITGLNLNIPESQIEVNSNGIAWGLLRGALLESDLDGESKYDLVITIDAIPEETWEYVSPGDRWLSLVDSRLKRMKDYDEGEAYSYMFDNFFPQLRNSSLITVYYDERKEPVEDAVIAAVEDETPPATADVADDAPAGDDVKPLFAIKTNLLFDLATMLNIELEIPIGKRWSIAGEWIFPWWSSSDKASSHRNSLQVLNGNIEGKYWFGDRDELPVMTGWHLGLYAGAGKFDLERNAEGYQGKQFMTAGISGGYAHTINKSGSLRMEYSLGVGFLSTEYDKYNEHWGIDDSWHTIRENSGDYTWIGPTRARVSLVWMLNRKVNKEK